MGKKTKIAITGMGCCCGAGNDISSVWESVLHNRVNCRTWDSDFFAPHRASPLFAVDCDDIISLCHSSFAQSFTDSDCKGTNRTIALALTAAVEALVSAQIRPSTLRSLRVGVCLGTTVGCTFHNEPYYVNWKKNIPQEIGPVFTYLSSNPAARIQQILHVEGPRATVTNACASGTDAIGIAKRWLENDICDLAIAGGADEISRVACHGFNSLMLFSQNPCRPFDASREGLNLGEGAGIMILERQESVDKKCGKPLGWLRGYGAASEAYHPTTPHPEGRGLQKAIQMACAEAGLALDEICYINAHGTGTRANDQAELTALFHLGAGKMRPAIVSTKGVTGHTLGAAGGIEAVLTILSLRHGATPGTTGCTTQDPDFPLQVREEDQPETLDGTLGMSQSLAFGGGNSALIMEAADK